MSKTWIIARRELAGYFDSLTAYVLIVIFLAITGFFVWLSPQNIFYQGQASMGWFFYIAYWTLLFFIPAITMRTLTEENRTGTIEMLATKAVSERNIVWGKFWGSYLLVVAALLCTLPYYISIAGLGHIDHATVIGGYIGLLLVSACYTALGIFASALTSNQMIALILSLVLAMLFHFIISFVAGSITGIAGVVLNYLSVSAHFDALSRGLIDTRDIVYFLSFIALAMLGAQLVLYRRNWTEK